MIVHETPRLLLQTWSLDDFDAFAVLARDPEVMRFISSGDTWSDAKIGWFMGLQSAYHETLGYCLWKLIDRADGAFIGFCGLAPLSMLDETEIGWWLKPSYWRKGLASEAADEVARAAFEHHHLDRIVARAYRANAPSVAIMERLGMTFDRALDSGPAGEVVLFKLNAPDRPQ
ncbi:MAG: GNAT family N-acetyltransferase [Stappiaceae bacterium]